MLKLQTRLTISLVGLLTIVFIVVAVAVTLLAYNYIKHAYAGEFENERLSLTHTWEEHSRDKNFKQALVELTQTMKAKVQIVDENGKVLFEAENGADYSDYESDKAARMIALAIEGKRNSDYSFWQAYRSGHIYLAYPMEEYGAKACLVVYELEYFQQVLNEFGYKLMALFIIALLVFYLFSRYFAGRILKFLLTANNTARQIADGDYGKRIHLESDDELEEFTHNFNKLAIAVESKINTIKQQKDELADYAQRQTEFTANAAHELKTPLSSMLLSAELLTIRNNEPDDIHLAQNIVDATRRLDQTVKALLELARLENNQLSSKLSIKPVEICSMITELAELRLQNYADKKLSVKFSYKQRAITIDTVPDLLIHALNNLIDNAGKYSPAGGAIKIGVAKTAIGVKIQVANTGAGISQEDIPYVFDRFYRADKSHSSTIAGSGLGLAIVKRIAEVLQGAIRVESEPGSWTTFSIELSAGKNNSIAGEHNA